MPENLIDVALFQTVSVPEGGDVRSAASVKTPFQQLANRSRYLLERLDAIVFGYFMATNAGNGAGDLVPITGTPISSDGFIVTADEIQVPLAGVYLVALTVELVEPGGGLVRSVSVDKGGVDTGIAAHFIVHPGGLVVVSNSAIGLVAISIPSSEKISIVSNQALTGAIEAGLTLVRVGDGPA
jgi:hypothetical protein